MKRKMTDFALAGICGSFGASGFRAPARACSSRSIDAIAREPKPQNASWINSRRVRVGRLCSQLCGICAFARSIDIKKGVEVKHRQGKFLQRLLFEEFRCELFLLLVGQPPSRDS